MAKATISLLMNQSVFTIQIQYLLSYCIKNGTLQPHPARVKTLQDLLSPNNRKEQQCVIGLFAHYPQWIPQYSAKK